MVAGDRDQIERDSRSRHSAQSGSKETRLVSHRRQGKTKRRDANLLRLMWVICFLLASVFSHPSHATTLRKLSLHELVASSDAIVVGQCEKSETVWLQKTIYTIATIRISQSAKGEDAPGTAIQVYTLGGSVKEPLPVKLLVPGAETIAVGEETLLFLEKFGDKRQFHRVVGMTQGKLPIVTDPKTGKKSVGMGQLIKGVKWVDRDGKPVEPRAQGAREETDEGDSLDGFLGRIHKIKAHQEAKAKNAKGGGK